MNMRHVLAFLAYVVPTFILGIVWHLVAFDSYYKALQVYRADIIIPFGFLSIAVQGAVLAYIYDRMFAGEDVLRGAVKFGCLVAPLAWSYFVIAVAAKHHMASVSGFVLIETAFVIVHYIVVSPLIALAFAFRKGEPHGLRPQAG
jgi:hypothetical protein